jgi:iron complex outermembrane receptor protein
VAPGDDERAHIEGQRQEVRGRADLGVNAGPLRYLRAEGTAQWYDHDEVESDGAIGTTFRLRTQTLNLTSKTRLGRLEGAIGAQALLRQYAAAGEEALTPEARTRNGALFIYQELPLGAAADTAEHGADEHASGVRLQLGARFDVFDLRSKDGDEKFGPGRARTFDNFSGSVGLSVPLADRVTLGLSAARAFRAPTVEELYSNAFHAAVGTYDVGNPELRAEINQGIDGVVRAQRGSVDAQLSAYYNRIDDFITPNVVGAVDAETGEPPVGAGDATVPLNVFTQREARLYGAEGRVEVDVGRRVVVGALGDVVRGEFVAGGALPFMPPARLGALARWDNGRWSVAGDVRRAFAQDRTSQASCGRAGGSAPEADELGVPCVDLSTPAYTLLNLSVGYTLYRGQRLHALTLRADNLLDEAYFDAASRIKYFARSPGRNVSLVYRVQF